MEVIGLKIGSDPNRHTSILSTDAASPTELLQHCVLLKIPASAVPCVSLTLGLGRLNAGRMAFLGLEPNVVNI